MPVLVTRVLQHRTETGSGLSGGRSKGRRLVQCWYGTGNGGSPPSVMPEWPYRLLVANRVTSTFHLPPQEGFCTSTGCGHGYLLRLSTCKTATTSMAGAAGMCTSVRGRSRRVALTSHQLSCIPLQVPPLVLMAVSVCMVALSPFACRHDGLAEDSPCAIFLSSLKAFN